MSINAQTILLNASRTLQDELSFVRWPLPELFDYLKDGLRTLILFRPNALRSIFNTALSVGPAQSIADVYEVIGVGSNILSESPTVFGHAPRVVDMRVLEAAERYWTQGASAAYVDNIAFDHIDKARFWVYPPNDGTGKLEIKVILTPEALVAANSGLNLVDYDIELPLDEAYSPTLTHYILHRAWAKDADFAGDTDRAGIEYKLFLDSLQMNKEAAQA